MFINPIHIAMLDSLDTRELPADAFLTERTVRGIQKAFQPGRCCKNRVRYEVYCTQAELSSLLDASLPTVANIYHSLISSIQNGGKIHDNS